MHTNYQPRKPGLIDLKTQIDKSIRRTMNALPLFDIDQYMAGRQALKLRYSDRGDFTRCYRGGF